MPRQRTAASTLQRLLLAALLLALLATQTLAHLHGVLHGPVHGSKAGLHAPASGHASADAAHDRQHAAPAQAPAQVERGVLFPRHGEPADCRLFDQACGGDAALPTLLFVLPAMPPAHLLRIFQGLIAARWAALFDARGPPFLA